MNKIAMGHINRLPARALGLARTVRHTERSADYWPRSPSLLSLRARETDPLEPDERGAAVEAIRWASSGAEIGLVVLGGIVLHIPLAPFWNA